MRRLVVLLAVLGCAEPFGVVGGAERIEPGAVVLDGYEAARACLASEGVPTTGDVTRVRWFMADRIEGEGVARVGYWGPPHDIYITRELFAGGEVADFRLRATAAHEAIHDLLQTGQHPPGAFCPCDPWGQVVDIGCAT